MDYVKLNGDYVLKACGNGDRIPKGSMFVGVNQSGLLQFLVPIVVKKGK